MPLRVVIGALLLSLSIRAFAQSPSPPPPLPSFLPLYFTQALGLSDLGLRLVDRIEQEKHSRYTYTNADHSISLTIERLGCDATSCNALFDNGRAYLNKVATEKAGRFELATETELRASWHARPDDNSVFGFRVPGALLLWSYASRPKGTLALDARFEALRGPIDRLRYDKARTLDNVEAGRWAAPSHRHAKHLLAAGEVEAAETVLSSVVIADPSNYEAQLDLAGATRDSTTARNSARAAYTNAEDPVLLARAASRLGLQEPTLPGVPMLTSGQTGLQVFLVPLPPCDLRLLDEAGALFQKATDIPVHVARLPEPWDWGAPQRIPDQVGIQAAIVQHLGREVDFTDWTQQRYAIALMDTVDRKDALSKYYMRTFVTDLRERPGQYQVDRYLERFLSALRPYRSGDIRTVYVGVTAANIYSGTANYVFSWYQAIEPAGGVSILSYAMMTTKLLGRGPESRRRLSERLAKELVPASFKALAIPRPVDPSDPYSYANGVDRMDQKTMVLSPPTQEALDRLR